MLTPTQSHSPVQRQRSPLDPPHFAATDVHVPVLPAMALSPSAPRTGAERDVLGAFWRRVKSTATTTHGIVAAVCVVCIVAAVVVFPSSSSGGVAAPARAGPVSASASAAPQVLISQSTAATTDAPAADPFELPSTAPAAAQATAPMLIEAPASLSIEAQVEGLPFEPLGVDYAAGHYRDISVGERDDDESDFGQDELERMIRTHEPRYLQLVSHLEKFGRRFTTQSLANDGVVLKMTDDGKGYGIFAAHDLEVGDLVPATRGFESMFFDGCPPTVPYHVDCEGPTLVDTCAESREFECAMHTDMTRVHHIRSFMTSMDFDLIVNHGLDAPFNVRTRQWRRVYTNSSIPPRVIDRFEVVRPIKAGEELLANYLKYLDDEDECDQSSREGLLDCLQPHSHPLPMWRPRRVQPDGTTIDFIEEVDDEDDE